MRERGKVVIEYKLSTPLLPNTHGITREGLEQTRQLRLPVVCKYGTAALAPESVEP